MFKIKKIKKVKPKTNPYFFIKILFKNNKEEHILISNPCDKNLINFISQLYKFKNNTTLIKKEIKNKTKRKYTFYQTKINTIELNNSVNKIINFHTNSKEFEEKKYIDYTPEEIEAITQYKIKKIQEEEEDLINQHSDLIQNLYENPYENNNNHDFFTDIQLEINTKFINKIKKEFKCLQKENIEKINKIKEEALCFKEKKEIIKNFEIISFIDFDIKEIKFIDENAEEYSVILTPLSDIIKNF